MAHECSDSHLGKAEIIGDARQAVTSSRQPKTSGRQHPLAEAGKQSMPKYPYIEIAAWQNTLDGMNVYHCDLLFGIG